LSGRAPNDFDSAFAIDNVVRSFRDIKARDLFVLDGNGSFTTDRLQLRKNASGDKEKRLVRCPHCGEDVPVAIKRGRNAGYLSDYHHGVIKRARVRASSSEGALATSGRSR